MIEEAVSIVDEADAAGANPTIENELLQLPHFQQLELPEEENRGEMEKEEETYEVGG